MVIGAIKGNFSHQKSAWIVIIFFAQTRLIWNILSACSKNWHMGYISHSIFNTEHKFIIKIEKSEHIQDFEIPNNSSDLTPRWILNFIFDNNFQFRQQICVQWWKLSEKYTPYVNFWNTYSKYSKSDEFVQRKSIITHALFPSQKLPFIALTT